MPKFYFGNKCFARTNSLYKNENDSTDLFTFRRFNNIIESKGKKYAVIESTKKNERNSNRKSDIIINESFKVVFETKHEITFSNNDFFLVTELKTRNRIYYNWDFEPIKKVKNLRRLNPSYVSDTVTQYIQGRFQSNYVKSKKISYILDVLTNDTIIKGDFELKFPENFVWNCRPAESSKIKSTHVHFAGNWYKGKEWLYLINEEYQPSHTIPIQYKPMVINDTLSIIQTRRHFTCYDFNFKNRLSFFDNPSIKGQNCFFNSNGYYIKNENNFIKIDPAFEVYKSYGNLFMAVKRVNEKIYLLDNNGQVISELDISSKVYDVDQDTILYGINYVKSIGKRKQILTKAKYDDLDTLKFKTAVKAYKDILFSVKGEYESVLYNEKTKTISINAVKYERAFCQVKKLKNSKCDKVYWLGRMSATSSILLNESYKVVAYDYNSSYQKKVDLNNFKYVENYCNHNENFEIRSIDNHKKFLGVPPEKKRVKKTNEERLTENDFEIIEKGALKGLKQISTSEVVIEPKYLSISINDYGIVCKVPSRMAYIKADGTFWWKEDGFSLFLENNVE